MKYILPYLTQNGSNYVVFLDIPNVWILGVLFVFISVSIGLYVIQNQGQGKKSRENMTDEQVQVVDLIKNNNGKLEQKEISKQLDWSDAKTSRITSELIEDGIITKKREDRSNIVEYEK